MVVTACLAGGPLHAAGGPQETTDDSARSFDAQDLLEHTEALVRWVREHDSELAAAEARVAEARADVGTSGLIPNPEVGFTLGNLVVGDSNPKGLGFNQTAVYAVGLSQEVELGKRGPRKQAAELRLEAAKQAALGLLADKVAGARLALGRVVYLRAKQAVLEDVLDAARRAAELEKSRLDHGAISGNDYNRLLLDEMSLEIDVDRSRAEYGGALAACRAALRAPCEQAQPLPAEELDVSAEVPATAGTNAQTLLDGRPDVRALRLDGQAALSDATLARRRGIPDPTFSLGYTRSQFTISGDNANTMVAGVAFPLPLFDHGQHDATKATAQASELRHTAQATLNQAHADLTGLLDRKTHLERGLAKLGSDALPRSRDVLATTEKAFDQGQVSLTDLLLARRQHTTLLLSLLDLRFDAFSVRNELRRTLGLDAATPATTSNHP